MRKRKLAGLILGIFVISGFVFAEAEKAKESEEVKKTDVKQMNPRSRSMVPRGSRPDRSQMLRERMQKQMEVHQAALKELADIKKIAEEEGATKTAEALQKLIDKKDAKFKENLQKFEKARRDRALKLQEKAKTKAKEVKEADPDTKIKVEEVIHEEVIQDKAEEK